MKEFYRKILLVSGSLLLCFLLLEGIFKMIALVQSNQAGPSLTEGLPYENTPNAKFWRFEREGGLHYYAHNAFGLRGKAITPSKPMGTYRIALLGDSVMHGGNVTQGETTADQLEDILVAGNPARKTEVLNFGVASYSLHEYAIQLKKKVLPFSPDMVIVGLCLNDYHIRSVDDTKADEKNSARSWWRERFANFFKSHFLEFLRSVLGVHDFSDLLNSKNELLDAESIKRLEGFDFVTAAERQAFKSYCVYQRLPLSVYLGGVVEYIREYRNPALWIKNQPDLQDMISDCRKNGVSIYFFCYPSNEQILPGYENSMPQHFLADWIRQNGGQYIELLDGFRTFARTHPSQKIFPRYDNLHMNHTGHRLAAQIIADHINVR